MKITSLSLKHISNYFFRLCIFMIKRFPINDPPFLPYFFCPMINCSKFHVTFTLYVLRQVSNKGTVLLLFFSPRKQKNRPPASFFIITKKKNGYSKEFTSFVSKRIDKG